MLRIQLTATLLRCNQSTVCGQLGKPIPSQIANSFQLQISSQPVQDPEPK